MSKKVIRLGDEIEDVTSKLSGIAIGRCEYLSGQVYWIIQPYTTDDNIILKEQFIPAQYCRRVGDGVYLTAKPQMGFSAEGMGVDRGSKA